MSDLKNDSDKIIIGNFEVAMQLSQQRTIKITGYRYAGESTEDFNARLDGAQDAMDRQFVRADIVNKEAQIEALIGNMIQYKEQLAELAQLAVTAEKEGAPKGKRLNSQQRQALTNSDQTLKNMDAQLKSLQAAIARGKQKVNGHLQA